MIYIAVTCEGRYTEQENRIIFPSGLLDWLLPIWTLPSVCKIRDKMQELTCDWVNSKVAKSEFCS